MPAKNGNASWREIGATHRSACDASVTAIATFTSCRSITRTMPRRMLNVARDRRDLHSAERCRTIAREDSFTAPRTSRSRDLRAAEIRHQARHDRPFPPAAREELGDRRRAARRVGRETEIEDQTYRVRRRGCCRDGNHRGRPVPKPSFFGSVRKRPSRVDRAVPRSRARHTLAGGEVHREDARLPGAVQPGKPGRIVRNFWRTACCCRLRCVDRSAL